MIKKLGIFFVLLFSLFSLGYSTVNVSNCGTSLNSQGETYLINNTLTVSGMCFSTFADDVVIDCQGNSIEGDGTSFGFYIDSIDNITVKNCNIIDFSIGMYLVDLTNSNFYNNNFSDSSTNLRLISSTISSYNNNFSNLNIKGTGISITLINVTSNIFDNVYINGASTAMEIQTGSKFNNFTNFNLENISRGILYGGGSSNFNNIYVNFTFSDSSLTAIDVRGASSSDYSENDFFNNINLINNSQYGFYLWNTRNLTLENIYFNNLSKGIYMNSYVNNNYFKNLSMKNLIGEDLYFQSTSNVFNNYFYMSNFTSKNNFYNLPLSQNYFNYTVSGIGNVGNYWQDFGVCNNNETRGSYLVCTTPNNYTINAGNNIYDYAPIVGFVSGGGSGGDVANAPSSNIFPAQGFVSILLALSILFIGFLFG